jgi:hypothetical protein
MSHTRHLLSLAFVGAVLGCTGSVTLAAPVTCSNVTLVNNDGECDLVSQSACSDMSFYGINCGDDGTCTCVVNENLDGSPVLVTDGSPGFCATLTVSMMHSIAAQCQDPQNPNDNLNIVTD